MQIKTFAQACKKLKIQFSAAKIQGLVAGKHKKAMIAYAKLLIIAETLNDGWQPNWDDHDEYKYWPWFYMDKPGFRFFVSAYSDTASDAAGGSRLCFKTRDLSDYAGKQFLSLWKDMMVIPKRAPAKKRKK